MKRMEIDKDNGDGGMQFEAGGSNAVILARQFNPTIFSEIWLQRNEIVSEADRRPGCLFSDDVVKIESADFAMLVLQPQLQFVPKVPEEYQQQLVVDKLGTIVSLLPQTPFAGLGLNFTWLGWSDDRSVEALSQQLFFNRENPCFNTFESDDSLFGGYASRNELGFRMKVHFMPQDFEVEGKSVRRLAVIANFHLGISPEENAVQVIEASLPKWNDARALVEAIIENLGDVN